MALTGPPAKPDKIGHSPTADWTDVPNVPYDDGGSRELPKSPGGRSKWKPQVVDWWEEVRRMPHCATWTDTDWRFALEIAYLKQMYWVQMEHGDTKIATLATEIRRREDQIGTTAEARRKLRIRYVAQEEAKKRGPSVGVPGGASVVSMEDRRNRLTG